MHVRAATLCLILTFQVVDGESAIIGDARENRETIHDDHIGMVKFSATSDDGYKKVLHAIELLLEGLHMDELPVAIQRRKFVPP
jgi:hypothetical protein